MTEPTTRDETHLADDLSVELEDSQLEEVAGGAAQDPPDQTEKDQSWIEREKKIEQQQGYNVSPQP